MNDAVCDSSTLILLAKCGLLDCLFDFVDCVWIPKEVYKEVVTGGKERGKQDALLVEREVNAGRIKVVRVKEGKLVEELVENFSMDRGELEAVALCIEKKALFLCVDDREAIKACRVYRIPFITALALALRALDAKKISISDFELAFSKLERIGFYSDEILDLAWKEAGLDGKRG